MTTPSPRRLRARPTQPDIKISPNAKAELTALPAETVFTAQEVYTLPAPAPGVVDGNGLAMDTMPFLGQLGAWAMQSAYSEGLGFLGYQYLAELTQRAEYRRPSEIIAKEMTRKWVTLTTTGDDKSERLEKLNAAMKRHDVQGLFREAAEQDGVFGRSQIFIALKGAKGGELSKPLIPEAKVAKGKLDYFRVIEPVWIYPGMFNASRPAEPDFYRPQEWWMMGDIVHTSRLLTFVSREVPDILKPSYQFGGLSLSQIAKPYVDNWLRTRQSVSDIIQSFSVMVLKTNMSSLLSGGGARSLLDRIAIFNAMRNNNGTFAIDKNSEEFENVSASLAGLDELQAQAQEHMASATGIPLVVLLGITPSGLNASSEGELKVFYDWVEAQQEHLFRKNLKRVLDVLQLDEFGDIDPAIDFVFNKLWTPSEAEQATINKTNAETDVIYVNGGIVGPEEVRNRLAADRDGPFHGLDPAALPAPPEPEEEEDDGNDPA